MHCLSNTDHGRSESISPFLVCDLKAQLAPLNRYGPSGLGVAVAEGLRAAIVLPKTIFASIPPAARGLLAR
jgi:hypothetical protein